MRQWIKRLIPDRFRNSPDAGQGDFQGSERRAAGFEHGGPSEEEQSEAELRRLQELIRDRKLIAAKTDISYHLWGFYASHFRQADPQGSPGFVPGGEWYDVKMLQSSAVNGLNRFDFELQGSKYTFVDDEEQQGWRENLKYFSLFLYDQSGRCLIEIPMKMRVDKWGRNYSILSEGPNAFLPGGWINDFVSVTLKHQHIRNQEIRAQKHRERLSEIEDLKDRFGISD